MTTASLPTRSSRTKASGRQTVLMPLFNLSKAVTGFASRSMATSPLIDASSYSGCTRNCSTSKSTCFAPSALEDILWSPSLTCVSELTTQWAAVRTLLGLMRLPVQTM